MFNPNTLVQSPKNFSLNNLKDGSTSAIHISSNSKKQKGTAATTKPLTGPLTGLQQNSLSNKVLNVSTCESESLGLFPRWGRWRLRGEKSSGDISYSQFIIHSWLWYNGQNVTQKTQTNTKKAQGQTFILTKCELWSSRRKQCRCTSSTITMGTSSVWVFARFSTTWAAVGTLSYFLVRKMCSRTSWFKHVTF